ncbi:DUF6438 domain-containing protein [Saprospira sp. CCB-QB6]|uniref:DUF6438 domain-containing protein n=1 Tax=Saprospira sp. CCB-QB6 TaxID=3023936 RepID=UPI00234B1424|nr:DUF6438 domain-containing protein [Saprospira sp. CCB-QB6]WCL80495.1 DUF6438 domain-containing protein [Saprospira sp. CCB-QB6]
MKAHYPILFLSLFLLLACQHRKEERAWQERLRQADERAAARRIKKEAIAAKPLADSILQMEAYRRSREGRIKIEKETGLGSQFGKGLLPSSLKNNQPLISFMTGPCYGKCPQYRLYFWANGDVLYEGQAFAKPMGKRECKIDPKQLTALLTQWEEQFATWERQYPAAENPLEGFPFKAISLKLTDGQKIILDYHDAPKGLIKLEKSIDSLAKLSFDFPLETIF